jgi:hypothetical protein
VGGLALLSDNNGGSSRFLPCHSHYLSLRYCFHLSCVRVYVCVLQCHSCGALRSSFYYYFASLRVVFRRCSNSPSQRALLDKSTMHRIFVSSFLFFASLRELWTRQGSRQPSPFHSSFCTVAGNTYCCSMLCQADDTLFLPGAQYYYRNCFFFYFCFCLNRALSPQVKLLLVVSTQQPVMPSPSVSSND